MRSDPDTITAEYFPSRPSGDSPTAIGIGQDAALSANVCADWQLEPYACLASEEPTCGDDDEHDLEVLRSRRADSSDSTIPWADAKRQLGLE